jgi:molecular chaperone HscB
VLGLKRAYHLDLETLNGLWRDRSRQVHPDRFTKKSAVLRRMSLQWTALVNDARRVLRDPVQRAWYLATGKSRPPEKGGGSADADFLEQVFEWRMSISAGDESVLDEVRQSRGQLFAQVDQVFTRWEAGAGDLNAVPALLQNLKYLDNLLQHDV